MLSRFTVLIVDDHPLFRQGLRQAVEADARFAVVGEADDGRAALQLLEQTRPDLALLDINLPSLSGLEVAREAQRKALPTKLVVLTMHKEEDLFNRALDFGVRGFVLKDSAAQDILASIQAVASGGHYLSPAISGFLIHRRERADELARRTPGLSDLTKAERRILRLIAEKKTSREIAAELFVSPRTVEAHRANVCSKLGLRGSHSLLQFALENRSSL